MKACANILREDAYLMLTFALMLILAGLLLMALAVDLVPSTNGLWALGGGAFVLGFGCRCLVSVLSEARRRRPPS